ncbi:hypothetical protein F4810DRAFT_565130 [Camillea tinctor]|nr:hypothetical protein F4810DRAFT_565130 [Camillea tinctor]
MCLRRFLHFSIHDTRALMTVEPFAGKDEEVFVNPFDVEKHNCDVELPPLPGTMCATEGLFNISKMARCPFHNCCYTSIVHHTCSRWDGNVDVSDCQFFTAINEYIPYESVMSLPEPGTLEATAANHPSWKADIKPYPHLFYVGHPYNRRETRDGEAIFASRSLFFALASSMYKKRCRIAEWIQGQDSALATDMLKTEASIKELDAEGVRWKMDDLIMIVKLAKELVPMSTSIVSIATELSKRPNLAIKSSYLWEPNDGGPLLDDLERIVAQWEKVINTWTQLNFGRRLRGIFEVSDS